MLQYFLLILLTTLAVVKEGQIWPLWMDFSVLFKVVLQHAFLKCADEKEADDVWALPDGFLPGGASQVTGTKQVSKNVRLTCDQKLV